MFVIHSEIVNILQHEYKPSDLLMAIEVLERGVAPSHTRMHATSSRCFCWRSTADELPAAVNDAREELKRVKRPTRAIDADRDFPSTRLARSTRSTRSLHACARSSRATSTRLTHHPAGCPTRKRSPRSRRPRRGRLRSEPAMPARQGRHESRCDRVADEWLHHSAPLPGSRLAHEAAQILNRLQPDLTRRESAAQHNAARRTSASSARLRCLARAGPARALPLGIALRPRRRSCRPTC